MRISSEKNRLFKNKVVKYIKKKPSAPFLVGFIILLITSAFLVIAKKDNAAESVANWAFLCLVIGVFIELESELHLIKKLFNFIKGLPQLNQKISFYFSKEPTKQSRLIRFASAKPNMAACSLFLLLTIIFTLPVFFNITTAHYGLPGDPTGGMYHGWWRSYAWKNNLDYMKNPLINAPFGIDTSDQPYQVSIMYLYDYLYKIFSPFIYWNFFIILSFFLSALFMYFLVYYITKNKLSSAISGIIFAFCPYHTFHAYQHLWLATIQWLPLFVLFLLKLVNESKEYRNKYKLLKNSLLCSMFYSIVVFENYYYGYFLIPFGITFFIIYFIYNSMKQKKVFINKNLILALGLTLIFAIIIALPFTYNQIKTFTTSPTDNFGEYQTYRRPFSELFIYGAKIRDYVLPPIDNPLWGTISERIITKYDDYDNLFENTLFLGYVPLLLGLFALIKIKATAKEKKKNIQRKADEENLKKWTVIFAFTGIAMFIFSGSPISSTFGFRIPLPSYFLYKFFPVFRVYARFGILVMLCVSVLAGIGLTHIFKKIKAIQLKSLIAALIILFILLEFINFPPYKITKSAEVPFAYQWLAKQPGNFAIVEYPFVRSDNARHYQYLLYQRFHQKKLVNGALIGSIGESLRKEMTNIQSQQTVRLLSSVNAKYVFIHKDIYQEGYFPKALKRYYNPQRYKTLSPEYNEGEEPVIEEDIGLKLVRSSNNIVVYEVTAKPYPIIIVFHRNIGKAEDWGEDKLWRWMDNNGEIALINAGERESSFSLEFNVGSFHIDRELRIYLNNSLLDKLKVKASEKTTVELKNIKLKPGINILKLYTPQGSQNIDEVLHNGDERNVSICLSEIEIS